MKEKLMWISVGVFIETGKYTFVKTCTEVHSKPKTTTKDYDSSLVSSTNGGGRVMTDRDL